MIGIALQFLTGGFTKALAWITASARNILIAALVASLAWGWLGHHNAAKYKRVLASTEQAYRNAQSDAKTAQIAANLAAEARYRSKADETDSDYRKALDGANSRSERFIASGGVRRPVACGTGSALAAAESGSAQGVDGGSEPAILVAVKPEDVDICTENTMRLQSAREWALTLGD
jgi:type II secretory pathway pseudopilin PulG